MLVLLASCTKRFRNVKKIPALRYAFKHDHIDYWVSSAGQDWERATFMYEKKDFVFSLFCVHLCEEKLCKGLWVKENLNINYPPKIREIKNLKKCLPYKLLPNP